MILENLSIKAAEGKHQIMVQDSFPGIRIRFENAIAYPGFINSHDHLDFNLFPPLANKIYGNYTEWANDIHEKNKELIQQVLKIPEKLRIEWGIYKNLLNGFTTVVNHGKKIRTPAAPIVVFQECYPLHSTAFERGWKWKLNNPLQNKKPYVMHIGEGTDDIARQEIDEVIRWKSLFKKRMIAVHGIAMNERQAQAFEGLIWCPASNFLLVGKTADVQVIKQIIPVVFGTDSTLSAGWNAWDHFREARDKANISETEIIKMLTENPANLWNTGQGSVFDWISWGMASKDLVITRNKNSFFELNPEDILLVISRSKIRLYDEELKAQFEKYGGSFSRIQINGRIKFVEGDLPGLIKKIHSYHPGLSLPITA